MSRSTLILTFAATVFATLALSSVDFGHLPWALSRAAGLASFAALTASVAFGLLISTKASDGMLPRPFVFEMHQFLSVLSLTLIALHIGSLVFDRYLGLSVVDLVVPFTSSENTFAFGIGVVAAWLTGLTTASFWVRSRIGVKRWRKLHYLTFAAWGTGLVHGLMAGTDTGAPVVYWSYVVSAALVLALTALRIVDATARRPAVKKPATTGAGRRVYSES
ncbi:MAG: ferric reductase-like transmembrane domain-containing protein [Dehalococcoidia bacterium]|nr:ferric reductase-like transmembrane domain-containing protein [Dehalococcoidia bacterium]